jgi:hypothetical protein
MPVQADELKSVRYSVAQVAQCTFTFPSVTSGTPRNLVAFSLVQFMRNIKERTVVTSGRDDRTEASGVVYKGMVLLTGGAVEMEVIFWGPPNLRPNLQLNVPYVASTVRLKHGEF